MTSAQRIPVVRLSPRGRTLLLRGLSMVGFLFLAKTLLGYGIEGAGGGGGIDALAYWNAASHVRDGLPVYGVEVGGFTAYPYPPPLAQLLVPFSYLPAPAFVWAWRALEIVALRVAVGSWTVAGIAFLFPPITAEIDAGNVHLLMAAVCALTMRGTAGFVAPVALLKFASLPLAPLGRRRDPRGLLLGVAAAVAVVVGSVVVAPAMWSDYMAYLGAAEFPRGWYNIGEGVPLVLRLALAGVLGIAAIRWIRLAPIAVVLAYPVLWFHSLSTLIAVVAPLKPAREPERVERSEQALVPRGSPA